MHSQLADVSSWLSHCVDRIVWGMRPCSVLKKRGNVITTTTSDIKQMRKDKSNKEQTTNFQLLLSRMVCKLFSTFSRHQHHLFCSIEKIYTRSFKQKVLNLMVHVIKYILQLFSVLFMIPMLMPFPLSYRGTLCEYTDSALPHEPITELFLLFLFSVSAIHILWPDHSH